MMTPRPKNPNALLIHRLTQSLTKQTVSDPDLRLLSSVEDTMTQVATCFTGAPKVPGGMGVDSMCGETGKSS